LRLLAEEAINESRDYEPGLDDPAGWSTILEVGSTEHLGESAEADFAVVAATSTLGVS
jgi:hypothetical protein